MVVLPCVTSLYTPERIAAIDDGLWTEVGPERLVDEHERAYREMVLAQYALYVEMADRVSARRSLANTFFLSLNTTIFAVVGVFWRDPPNGSDWILVFPLVALIDQQQTPQGPRLEDTRKALGWKTPADALDEQLPPQLRCCYHRLNPVSTPRGCSATGSAMPACSARWARSVTASNVR